MNWSLMMNEAQWAAHRDGVIATASLNHGTKQWIQSPHDLPEYPALVAHFCDTGRAKIWFAVVTRAHAQSLLSAGKAVDAAIDAIKSSKPGKQADVPLPTQQELNFALIAHILALTEELYAVRLTTPERYTKLYQSQLAIVDRVDAARKEAILRDLVAGKTPALGDATA